MHGIVPGLGTFEPSGLTMIECPVSVLSTSGVPRSSFAKGFADPSSEPLGDGIPTVFSLGSRGALPRAEQSRVGRNLLGHGCQERCEWSRHFLARSLSRGRRVESLWLPIGGGRWRILTDGSYRFQDRATTRKIEFCAPQKWWMQYSLVHPSTSVVSRSRFSSIRNQHQCH
jgi:hypothetical protein